MSTSRIRACLAAVVAIALLAKCSPPTNCLRFSDCGDGLTCWEGKCVPAPASLPEAAVEAASGGSLDGAGSGLEPDAEADGTSGAASPEASVDVDGAGGDSSATGDDAAGDATVE